ncbi:MAG: Hsp20/alpha crystallin family protein [Thermanaerothrix sp.]|uniref:Hsp20/alpha crystallin family protein n=1 Tax=Thermanaerothrix solaris TaxID=3058434 RepID=A0ABU3NQA8_9CHLR|nr:Hsp20/alpha crystallin family protein [Thermanaerothrix sp. 4228-RoL]MDT8898977.1 Hsp20/alpha crystallin family protein [Thermanaerothrix sp. 4228-RoL]
MMMYMRMPYGRWMMRRWLDRALNEEWPEESPTVWVPVDVRVNDEGYEITALVPGVKPEELQIQIQDNTVTLQGELKPEHDEKATYILQELPRGRFMRVIHLPDELDSAAADASLKDGVLTLRVPKAAAARPRTIKVVAR